jgi:uncharacterized membrane protein
MSDIFFKTWRIVSFLFLIVVLMFCYVQLPDNIAVSHNESGEPIGFMDKQNFFYLSVGVIVGINFLFGLLKGRFAQINYSRLAPKSEWAEKPLQLKSILGSWADAFPATVNSYLIFVLFGLHATNLENAQNLDRDYGWFLILGGFILLILLFFVPVRILFTSPKPE